MQKIKELSKQWGQDIEVNGKQIEVRVTIEVSYDEYFDLSHFDAEDQELLAKKIDSGLLTPVRIQVLGHIEGHLFGIDSMGGVLMSTKTDIDDTVEDYNMVQNCLEESKLELEKFLKKIA